MADKKQQRRRHRGANDDVERAPEAGDPKETGRSHGKPVDQQDDRSDAGPSGKSEKGNHWESGRHQAT